MAAVSNNNNVLDSFYCPVYSEPLTDAVMLIPCGHTIGEVAARQMYKGMQDEGVEQKGPCPLCRVTVKSYFPNYAVRDLVDAHVKGLLIAKPVADPEVVAQAAAAPEKNVHEIPFPGKGADFTYLGYSILPNGSTSISFISLDSFLSNVDFTYGKTINDSSINIDIRMDKNGISNSILRIKPGVDYNLDNGEFNFNHNKFIDYITQCGITYVSSDSDTRATNFDRGWFVNRWSYAPRDNIAKKILFKIVMMHNHVPIPKEYIPKLDVFLQTPADDECKESR